MSFKLKEQIHPKSNLNHPIYPELVNNFVLYHKQTDPAKAKFWQNQPPKYENYDSIGNIYQDIIDDPQGFYTDGSITVRVPVSNIWSCDANLHFSKYADAETVSKHNLSSIMGYDRLNKYDEILAKAPKFMKQKDGFSKTSDTLHAMVRWIYNDKGEIVDFALVKDRGNLRCHMALASTMGKDVEVLVAIDFHKPGTSNTKMLKDEAETFVEDAKDRRGHDSITSFRSGYLAGRLAFIKQKDFLEKTLKVDFGGVINAERRAAGKEELEFDLTSTQQFDFNKDTGVARGYIHKYGADNIKWATETLKKIMNERGPGSGGRIVTSAIHTFAKTFYYLTSSDEELGITDDDGKRTLVNALSDKETVQSALVYMYTRKVDNRHDKTIQQWTMDLSGIQKSNSDKDTTWLAFKRYMPALLEDLRQGKGNTKRYRSSNAIIQKYIHEIEEGHLQVESARLVDSFAT